MQSIGKGFRLFGVFAIFMVLAATGSFGGEKTRVLNVNESDWPPYFFAGKPDLPQGFGKELLTLVIPETGYSCRFAFYPVKRMYAYLENGKLDISIFSYKKSRESFVTFGKEPLFTSGYRPIVLANSQITINSLKDFDSLRVGHLAGLKYSRSFLEYIEKREQDNTLITTTLGTSCLRMLLAGMIDIFVDSSDTVLWRAKEMDALDSIKVLDFDIQTKAYFVVVSNQSKVIADRPAFLNQLDQSIQRAKADGRFGALAKRYGIQ